MLWHSVWYATSFVVGLEDIIVNLKFLSAIVPVKQNATVGRDGKERSIQSPATIYQAWIDKWDDNRGKRFSWRAGEGHRSDQRGLTPNCENANSGADLRDDDRCNFVGDNGLGLVIVNVDCLKGAHAKRLPAVGHPVSMDTLKRRCYGNRRWCGTGSCTHAPQAAVNDIAPNLEAGSKHTDTPTKKAAHSGNTQNIFGSNNPSKIVSPTSSLMWAKQCSYWYFLNNVNHFQRSIFLTKINKYVVQRYFPKCQAILLTLSTAVSCVFRFWYIRYWYHGEIVYSYSIQRLVQGTLAQQCDLGTTTSS